MTAPTYKSDGFRDETCTRCGDVIGFAFFDAREYVVGGSLEAGFETVTDFTHRDPQTYAFPSWCERRATR